MKKTTLFIVTCILGITCNAQTTYIDKDSINLGYDQGGSGAFWSIYKDASKNALIIGDTQGTGAGNLELGIGEVKVSSNIKCDNWTITNGFAISNITNAPASSSAYGFAGEIRVTADYIYFCYAPNSWKRIAWQTF
jgi:hypothetical protein